MDFNELMQGIYRMGGVSDQQLQNRPPVPPGAPIQQGVAGPPWQSLLNLAALNDRPAAGVTQSMPPFGAPGKIDPKILNDLINRRNLMYHATTPEGLQGIMESGQINPSGIDPNEVVHSGSDAGVSVSRVPKAKTTAYGGAITLALDPTQMPANRSFAEYGYGKTRHYETGGLYKGLETKPNERFEFENRTYNEPISTKAVKEVLIDKSGLPDNMRISTLQDLIKKHLGVPTRVVDSGAQQHMYRALLGKGIIK